MHFLVLFLLKLVDLVMYTRSDEVHVNEHNGILSFKYLLNKYRACSNPHINLGNIIIIIIMHISNFYIYCSQEAG